MKATVVIPVYNVEKYLRRCLDSLLVQTYEDFEIICVNDKSPDNSQKILDEYSAKYPDKIKVLINEENMGQGRSRMRGIDIARGEYIFFIDSDDHVAKDYIERFLSEVKNNEYDVVIAGYTKDIEGKYVEHDIPDDEFTLVCYPVAGCKMYRKAFIQENGIDFTSARIGEDIYFSVACYCSNVRAKIIHYFGYYYYLNNNSTTKSISYNKKYERHVSKMFDMLLEKYPIKSLTTHQRHVVEYAYAANMVNALVTYGHGCKPKMMKEKYNFFIRDLEQKFPRYRSNPYFAFKKMPNVSGKIKWGTCVSMKLIKHKLGWPLYMCLSLI